MFEVAVEDLKGFEAARLGGAGRVELCGALGVGGLTPSAGQLRQIVGRGLPVHVLVRCRAGDFRYDAAEREVMMADSIGAMEAGVDGLVFGAGDRDGLDVPALVEWTGTVREACERLGRPVSLTLHRVFDLLDDPFEGLEAAVALGFDRILTSAGKIVAGDGLALFAQLATQADGRIALMAGGGLRPDAIAALREAGVREFHASARTPVAGTPDARLLELGFLAGQDQRTERSRVRAYVEAGA